MQPWPAESTKRSRSGQCGSRGIVTQVALPQHVGHRRRAERQARVARVGLLHGVDRERADRVDAELVERLLHGAQEPSSLFDLITRRDARRKDGVKDAKGLIAPVHLIENRPERFPPVPQPKSPLAPTRARKPLEWSAAELAGRRPRPRMARDRRPRRLRLRHRGRAPDAPLPRAGTSPRSRPRGAAG